MSHVTLNRIKIDQNSEEHRLRETIRRWYDDSRERPCWEVVIQALVDVGKTRVAKEIADQQEISWDQFRA